MFDIEDQPWPVNRLGTAGGQETAAQFLREHHPPRQEKSECDLYFVFSFLFFQVL